MSGEANRTGIFYGLLRARQKSGDKPAKEKSGCGAQFFIMLLMLLSAWLLFYYSNIAPE